MRISSYWEAAPQLTFGIISFYRAAEPRLRRTRAGLLEQLDDAHQRGWAGEVERLNYILAGVDDKLVELVRNERRLAWIATPTRKPGPLAAE